MAGEHYCIQKERIEKMDTKLDEINDHFQVDGIVGKMSGQLSSLTTLVKNGKKESGTIPPKLAVWVVLGLVLIIAALVGVQIPM